MQSSSAPPSGSPADCHVSPELVQRLVADQFPAFVAAVQPFSIGWDNEMYRLGDRWLVRMPRHAVGCDNVLREQAWLPTIAGLVTTRVPVPIAHGRPGRGYPHHWSIVPFVDGSPAGDATADDDRLSPQLAAFVGELHQPCHPDAPAVASRAGGLMSKGDAVLSILKDNRIFAATEAQQLVALWNHLASTPPYRGPSVWVHGDLHPYNLVTRNGRLATVVDWGDLFGGDPSADYAAAWMLFEASHHQPFRSQTDEEMWRRGAGWALYFGVFLTKAVADGAGAGFERVSRHTLRRLVETSW